MGAIVQLPPAVVVRHDQDGGQVLLCLAGVGGSGCWSMPATAECSWAGTVPWHIIERFRAAE